MMSPKKASMRKALTVLGVTGAITTGLLTGVSVANADPGPDVCVAVFAVGCNNVGGFVGARHDYGYIDVDSGRGCDRCDGNRQERFEASWARYYQGGDAFPWETNSRFGCLWIANIHRDGYHLELVDRGGDNPWIYWVRNW